MSDQPRRNAGVHFPPPLLFVVPLFAGVFLHRRFPLPLMPVSWRVVGVPVGWLLIGIFGVLLLWGAMTFARHRTPLYPNRPATDLVVDGPFRFSRNPMYVGLSSLYLGATVLSNTLWPLLFFPLVVVLVHFLVIRREERYLTAEFGKDYESYCAGVRRWL